MLAERHRESVACLIVARNLGDAVIQSAFLKELVARRYAEQYVVWARPQAAFLFRGIPSCEVVCSQFPVGTRKEFGPLEGIRFLRAARRVRTCRPSVSLDLIGDFRERLFARLAGSRKHLHIGWEQGHPFSRIIRNPFGRGSPLVTIPARTLNVYAAHEVMLEALVPGMIAVNAAAPGSESARAQGTRGSRVGLHPFASQECKLWPAENWRQLIREILQAGAEVWAFGAPGERQDLVHLLGDTLEQVKIVTVSVESFAEELANVDVLVGLDSFAVHLAGRQGVQSITINAGNPPDFWRVPRLGTVLASPGGCSYYPCFNAPRCKGSAGEYACVKAISVAHVLQSVAATVNLRQ